MHKSGMPDTHSPRIMVASRFENSGLKPGGSGFRMRPGNMLRTAQPLWRLDDVFHDLFQVTKDHHSFIYIKQMVIKFRIPRCQRPLVKLHGAHLGDIEDGHAKASPQRDSPCSTRTKTQLD